MNNRHVPLSILFRLGKQSFLQHTVGSTIAGLILAFGIIAMATEFENDIYGSVISIFLLGIPFGLILFIVSLVPAYKKYKLLKDGQFKKGYIVMMLPASDMHGEGKHLTIHYWYQGSFGNKLYAQDNTPDMFMFSQYKKDDEIKIAVSETNEAKSCIVSPSEIKRNGWTQ
jgi:hypothetical protein